MSKRIHNRIVAALALLCISFSIYAEDDTGAFTGYTPYSVFGLGDIYTMGSAYTSSMGGVGIASRNNRFINPMNPAAVTARDSLAFMVDFSLFGGSRFMSQDTGVNNKSLNNTFNIGDCIISFPIYKSSAMMVGIMPYSSTGYCYQYIEQDRSTIADVGNVGYSYNGKGGVYRIFAAAGVTFFKRLSLGAEATYYFGNIVKSSSITFSDESYLGNKKTDRANVNTFSGKFGIQYFQPVGERSSFGLGGTYRLGSRMKGIMNYSGEENNISGLRLSNEIGAGLSFHYHDNMKFEFDYINSDWRNSGFEKDEFFSVNGSSSPFVCTVAQSFRIGAEVVPDRRDARYYMKRVAYRAGAYYNKEYYNVGGHDIKAMGVTLGATFPVFNGFNGLTVAVDFGQRGSLQNSLVRERYINFSVAVNLYDRWFYKMQYE